MAAANTSIVLTADDRTRAGFASAQRGLENMRTSALSLTGVFAALGAGLTVAGLTGFVRESIAAADALTDLRDRTGLTIETLNGLQWAAQIGDTSMDALASGVGRLNKAIGEAQSGNATMAENLRRLGISATDPEQALYQLADAVAAMPEPSRQAAELSKVLGKSYQELLPLLAGGAGGLRSLIEEGQRLNPVTTELAEASAEFTDNMDRLKKSAGGAGTILANTFLPALNSVAESFLRAQTAQTRFMAAASLGVNIFNPIGQQLKDLREEIKSLTKEQELAERLGFGRYANIDRKIEAAKKLKSQLEEVQREEALALNPKPTSKNLVTDEDAEDNQSALRKALDTKPLEEFVRSFADKRRQVSAEMAKLRADLTGASVKDATGGDIASEIAKGRSAVENNDIGGADASAKRAAEMLKSLKDNGGIADEFSYYTRELEQLQQASLTRQETIAQTVLGDIKAAIASTEINAEKLKLQIDVPFLHDQLKAALAEIYNQVEAGRPVSVPLAFDPSRANQDRISIAAAKHGGRP